MHSFDEWVRRFNSYEFLYLKKQYDPIVTRYNRSRPGGETWYRALRHVLIERKSEDLLPEVKSSRPLAHPEEEEEGTVEIISYGGKGQTLRIVHPKDA